MSESNPEALTENREPGLKRSPVGNIVGVVLLLTGILLFLALFSYTERDLSSDEPVSNIVGTVGHHLGGVLLLLFGQAGYIAGPFLLLSGFVYFRKGILREPVLRLIALLLMSIAGAVLLYLFGAGEPEQFWSSGGIIGRRLGGLLEHLFGFYGSVIIGVGIFILGIFLGSDDPPAEMVSNIYNSFNRVIDYFRAKLSPFMERMTSDLYVNQPQAEMAVAGAESRAVAEPPRQPKTESAPSRSFEEKSGSLASGLKERLDRLIYKQEGGDRPWFEVGQAVEPSSDGGSNRESESSRDRSEPPGGLSQSAENIQRLAAQAHYATQVVAPPHPDENVIDESLEPSPELSAAGRSVVIRGGGENEIEFYRGYFSEDEQNFYFQKPRTAPPTATIGEEYRGPLLKPLEPLGLRQVTKSSETVAKSQAPAENQAVAAKRSMEEASFDVPVEKRFRHGSFLPSALDQEHYAESSQEIAVHTELPDEEIAREKSGSIAASPVVTSESSDATVDSDDVEYIDYNESVERRLETTPLSPEDDSLSEDESLETESYDDEELSGEADLHSDDEYDMDSQEEIEDGDDELSDEYELNSANQTAARSEIAAEPKAQPLTSFKKDYGSDFSDSRVDPMVTSQIPALPRRIGDYRLAREILKLPERVDQSELGREIEWTRSRLEVVLKDYGIQAKVVRLQRGPIVTLYEIKLEPGVKVSRVIGISDEIKMHLEAQAVRILAPIPGRATVGIEIPNRNRQAVLMGEIVRTDSSFFSSSRELSLALGKDIAGNCNYVDLTKMPHLLMAGATGAGKSVYMNAIIASLLYTRSPEELRFIMIDPKMVELNLYEGIPHLLMPVITDVRRASRALAWAVVEMERRYSMLSRLRCRDIRSYNERIAAESSEAERMPYIVILIDELSDLMMVSAKDVEDSIIRLTQKARAVGIHVVMATQRPSVDVITALIKANCPARIAFQVAQKTDSRIILDNNGAEALVGRGDMLYRSPVATGLTRLQAPLITDEEIEKVVKDTARYGKPVYVDLPGDSDHSGAAPEDDGDEALFQQAWEVVIDSGKTSTSYIQRRLRIGYNRAARLVEMMEERGYLTPQMGNRPREILKGAHGNQS